MLDRHVQIDFVNIILPADLAGEEAFGHRLQRLVLRQKIAGLKAWEAIIPVENPLILGIRPALPRGGFGVRPGLAAGFGQPAAAIS